METSYPGAFILCTQHSAVEDMEIAGSIKKLLNQFPNSDFVYWHPLGKLPNFPHNLHTLTDFLEEIGVYLHQVHSQIVTLLESPEKVVWQFELKKAYEHVVSGLSSVMRSQDPFEFLAINERQVTAGILKRASERRHVDLQFEEPHFETTLLRLRATIARELVVPSLGRGAVKTSTLMYQRNLLLQNDAHTQMDLELSRRILSNHFLSPYDIQFIPRSGFHDFILPEMLEGKKLTCQVLEGTKAHQQYPSYIWAKRYACKAPPVLFEEGERQLLVGIATELLLSIKAPQVIIESVNNLSMNDLVRWFEHFTDKPVLAEEVPSLTLNWLAGLGG